MVWYTVNGAQRLSGHTSGSSQAFRHGILLQRRSTNCYKCRQPDARWHCMCGYSFTLIFISSRKVQGYSKFHLNVVFMDARKTSISPPPPGWFQKLVSSNSYAYFLWDQPSVAQHRPNPGTNFVIGTSCQFIVLFIVVRAWRVGGEEDVQLFRFAVIRCCVLSGMVRTQRWRWHVVRTVG